MPQTDFEQRRFRTAAAHYLAGRPPYADRLIERVALLTGLTRNDRVLDLGCGPGQLARAFAPLVHDVIAIDPEPAMLQIAQSGPSPTNIEWRQARSDDLTPAYGPARVATIGRAFHWMDREDTLRRLDAILVPGGAVALFRDIHPDLPDNAWHHDFRAVLQTYRGAEPTKGQWRHEGVLLASPFGALEAIEVYERRTISAEVLIERALSLSSTSRARLGDQAEAMIAQLRSALPPGDFPEVVVSQAVIARRP